MPRARSIVGDVNSAELDELRRQFNNLLVVLGSIAAAVDAGDITADEAFTVLTTTLEAGVDNSITGVDAGANDYTGTGAELLGIKPTPLHPRRRRTAETIDLDASSNF